MGGALQRRDLSPSAAGVPVDSGVDDQQPGILPDLLMKSEMAKRSNPASRNLSYGKTL
jgi:hypothetical protein